MNRNDDPDFVRWARAVKIRDNCTCQVCDARGTQLESHHKNAWNAYPEERYSLDNGVTLCKQCHNRFHNIYGFGNNTEYQFEQYMKTAEIFKKLLLSDNPPGFLTE